jgi:NAD+ kinase
MRIAVHGKEFNRQSAPFILKILEILHHAEVEIFISSKFSQFLRSQSFKHLKYSTYEPGQAILERMKCFISIGGDGTLLETVTHIGRLQIPVLGINTGRLGFLATISKEETEQALMKVLAGKYSLDKRSVLRLETIRSTEFRVERFHRCQERHVVDDHHTYIHRRRIP